MSISVLPRPMRTIVQATMMVQCRGYHRLRHHGTPCSTLAIENMNEELLSQSVGRGHSIRAHTPVREASTSCLRCSWRCPRKSDVETRWKQSHCFSVCENTLIVTHRIEQDEEFARGYGSEWNDERTRDGRATCFNEGVAHAPFPAQRCLAAGSASGLRARCGNGRTGTHPAHSSV
jgi:hypothetical protein